MRMRTTGLFALMISCFTGTAFSTGGAQSAAATQVRQWTLGPAAAVIGGPEKRGMPDLARIRQVVALGGDSILVSDIGVARIMLFDGGGALQRIWARPGNEANEFRAVHKIGLSGDSIWVTDGFTRVRKYFSVDGTLLSIRPLPGVKLVNNRVQGLSLVVTDGFLSGDRVVAFQPDRAIAGWPAREGSRGQLVVVDSASAVLQAISSFANPREYLQLRVGEYVHQMVPNQFQSSPLWSVSDDGSTLVFLQRSAPSGAAPASYRVWSWEWNGTQRYSTGIPFTPQRIPGTVVDSLVRYYAGQMRINDPAVQNAELLVRDSLAAPENYPAATNIVIARGGEVWIAREGISGRVGPLATNYDILDTRGQLVGRLSLPRPARLLAATATSVWIAEYDASDLPTLRRFPIIR